MLTVIFIIVRIIINILIMMLFQERLVASNSRIWVRQLNTNTDWQCLTLKVFMLLNAPAHKHHGQKSSTEAAGSDS
jgi:hypothetical protein